MIYRLSTMNDDNSELSSALHALAHPARLTILRFLAERSTDQCCSDVTCCLPLAQSTVSQHLKVLLEAGLVRRHAEGRRNRYSLHTDRIEDLRRSLSETLGEIAMPAGSAK